MAKLPPYMTLISMRREGGELRAKIRINPLHPSAWPIVARALASYVRQRLRTAIGRED